MTSYTYAVNNMPQQWSVEVKDGEASTTAFGRTFNVKAEEGKSADDALEALEKEFEEIGWFISLPFSKASEEAAAK